MKDWGEYYTEWTKEDYLKHIEAVKGICHRIMRFTSKDKPLLEVGFGSGQMSIYLNLKGREVIGIDSNETQVDWAKKLAKELDACPVFLKMDIFDHSFGYKPFGCAFSQGLLEHFLDEKIKELIAIQLKTADKVCFSVPLDKFGHQSRGDERLLPAEHWKKLINKYKILYWETYADGKQLLAILEEEV